MKAFEHKKTLLGFITGGFIATERQNCGKTWAEVFDVRSPRGVDNIIPSCA